MATTDPTPRTPGPRRNRFPGLRRPGAPAAVLLATVLAAAGCSGGSSGGGAPAVADTTAPVTLTWWTGQEAEAQDALQGLAKEFTAQHPNVTVQVSSGASTTDELLQKLTATFVAGTYPDISYAFGNWATELADSGKALDLTAVSAQPESAWQDFPQSSRQTATVDGRVIGFPAVVGNLGVIYNPTLFAAAGVAEPTLAWTWDDFRAAARKITDPARNIYGIAYSVSGSEDTTWHFWPLLWQNGGEILSADGKKTAFSSDAGARGLELLRAMAVDDRSVYLDQTDEKYGPLFASGRIGMMINGPWTLYDLVQAKTPYKVTVLPGTNGDHQTSSATDLWVGLDHDDPARAYWVGRFLQFLATPEADAKWNLAQGNLPLRPSERSSAAFQQYVTQYPGADVFLANLADNAEHAKPTISGYVEVSGIVGKAVSKVLQGAATPKQALADAAKQADQALADR